MSGDSRPAAGPLPRWLVYAILLRYWEWTSEEDVRPLIFLMSD